MPTGDPSLEGLAAEFNLGNINVTKKQQLEIKLAVGLKRLLGLLSAGDLSTRRDALWLLWKLSQDDETKADVLQLGGLDPIIDCLELESNETRRYALWTLCNLSFDDRNNAEIGAVGGIGPIIDCIDSSDATVELDVETVRAALRTLCNLSINDDNKEEIRLLGGLAPIVSCLSSKDVKTRRDSLRTLCNLSINPPNKAEIADLGGLKKIIDCLDYSDLETKRYALASLINLSNDEDSENDIRVMGGLPKIVDCLHVSDIETKRFALRCLCNLSINASNKVAIGEIPGAIEEPVKCLDESDLELRCYALATIMHLCVNEDNNAKMEEMNATAPVLSCLRSPDPDNTRYAIGALSIMFENEGNRKRLMDLHGEKDVLGCIASKDTKTKKHGLRAVCALLKGGYLMSQDWAHEDLVRVAEGLESHDPETKRYAAEALMMLATTPAHLASFQHMNIPAPYSSMVSQSAAEREDSVAKFKTLIAEEDAKLKSETEAKQDRAAKRLAERQVRRDDSAAKSRNPDELQAEVGRLEEKVASLEKSIANKDSQIARMQRDGVSSEAAAGAPSSRASPSGGEDQRLADERNARKEALTEELQEKEAELSVKTQELDEMEQRLSSLKNSLQDVMEREGESLAKIKILQRELKFHSENAEQQSGEARVEAEKAIDQLNINLAKAEADLKETQDSKQAIAAELADKQSIADKQAEELRAKDSELSEKTRALQQIQREEDQARGGGDDNAGLEKVRQLQRELELMEDRFRQTDRQLADLQKERERAEREHAKQLEELRKPAGTSEEVEAISGKVDKDRVNALIHEKNHRIRKLSEALDEANAEKTKAMTDRADALAKSTGLQQELASVGKTAGQSEEAERMLAEANHTLSVLEEQLEKLKDELQSLQTAKFEFAQEIFTLRDNMKGFEDALDRKDVELKRKREEGSVKDQQIAVVTSQLRKLEKDIANGAAAGPTEQFEQFQDALKKPQPTNAAEQESLHNELQQIESEKDTVTREYNHYAEKVNSTADKVLSGTSPQSELDDLNRKLAEKKAEMAELVEKEAALRNRISALERAMRTASPDDKQVVSAPLNVQDMGPLQEEIEELQKKLEASEAARRDAEMNLVEKDSATASGTKRVNDDIAQARSRIKILEEELKLQEDADRELRTEKRRLQEQLNEARAAITDLQSGMEKTNAAATAGAADGFAQLEQQLHQALEDNRMAAERIRLMESELDSQAKYSQGESDRLQDEIKKLRGQMAQGKYEVESTSGAYAHEVDLLRSKSAELEHEVDTLKSVNKSSQSQIELLQRELKGQSDHFDQESKKYEAAIQKLRQTLADYNSQSANKELLDQAAQLEAELDEANQRLISQENENRAASMKIRDLENELKAQVDHALAEARGIDEEKQAQYEELLKARNEATSVRGELEAQIEEMKKTEAELRFELSAKDTDYIDAAKGRIRELEEELETQVKYFEEEHRRLEEDIRLEMEKSSDEDRAAASSEIQAQRARISELEKELKVQAVMYRDEKIKLQSQVASALTNKEGGGESGAIVPVDDVDKENQSANTPVPAVPTHLRTKQDIEEGIRTDLNDLKATGIEDDATHAKQSRLLNSLLTVSKKSRYNRNLLKEENIIKYLKLLAESQHRETRRNAVHLLKVLGQDESALHEYAETGCLEVLAACLEIRDDALVRSYALDAIAFITQSQLNAEHMMRLGILKFCIDILDRRGGDPDDETDMHTMRNVVKIIRNLCYTQEAKEDMHRLGGIRPLLDTLVAPEADEEIQRYASRALSVLCVTTENRVKVREAEGIKDIIDFLLVTRDPEARRNAVLCLVNLSVNVKNKIQIRQYGGIEPLVQCLRVDDINTRHFTIRTLCNLATKDDNKLAIYQADVIGPLLTNISHTLAKNPADPSDVNRPPSAASNVTDANIASLMASSMSDSNSLPLIRRYGLRCLACLATKVHLAHDLLKNGDVQIIVNCLNSRDEHTQMEALELLAHISDNAEVRKILRDDLAIRAIVKILGHEQKPMESKQKAARVLLWCAPDPECQDEMLDAHVGAIGVLVTCMKQDNMTLKRSSLMCVNHLSAIPKAQQHLLKENGMEALITLLDDAIGREPQLDEETGNILVRGQAPDLDMLHWGLDTLCHLTESSELRDETRKLGGLAIVNRSMVIHDVSVRRSAVKALYQLSRSAENIDPMIADRGLDELLRSATFNDVETRRYALRALCNVAQIPEHQAGHMRFQQIIPNLYSKDDETVSYAMILVSRLVENNERNAIDCHRADGVERIVAMLSHPKPDVRLSALTAVAEIAAFESARCEIATDAGLAKLVEFTSSEEPEVRRMAVKTLMHLSFPTGPNDNVAALRASQIKVFGGLRPIVEAVSSEDKDLSKHAVRTLFNLTTAVENAKDAVRMKAIPALAHILKHGEVSQKKVAISTLCNLSGSEIGQKEIIRQELVTYLVDGMGMNDKRAKRDAVRTLANLVEESGHISDVATPRVLQLIGACLISDNNKTRKSAVRFMALVSPDENVKKMAKDCSVLQGLLKCTHEEDTKEHAASALQSLCLDADNRREVLRLTTSKGDEEA